MKPQVEMNWSKYMRVFSELNRGRPTRLAVFEGAPGSMSDLWLEDGLNFLSVEIASVKPSRVDVEIMLDQGPEAGASHMCHSVNDARVFRIVLGVDEEADSLEIENANGETTVLRFEMQGV